MKKSNYQFQYHPVNQPGGWGFEVKITEEFRTFAIAQTINPEYYERYVRELIKTLTKIDPGDYRRSFCGFDGGLLWKLEIPGNASGLALEKNIGEWYYLSHNVDSPVQAIILFAVMCKYLGEIEMKMSDKE